MEILLKCPPYTNSNEESWVQVAEFIEEYPDTESWLDYKRFLRPVICTAKSEGLDHLFRAGGSMSDTTLSTADRPLEAYTPQPPRITIRAQGKQKSVAWSHSNLWFSEPERMEIVTSDNVLPILKSFLADLWRETRPFEALPVGLRSENR